MNAKQSPSKISLGMMRGKPITTSVPVIHYHAIDDELEEFYLSTDEDKHPSPDSEPVKIPPSPSKSPEKKRDGGELSESNLERLNRTDGNVSEGTPPTSDPWKVLSDIRGKITKTFEEKISEIKSDKKKKRRRSRDNSSISDSEDLGDMTPTEENTSERQEKEGTPSSRHKTNSRFVGFSHVKTGLKTKNSEEDSVESGVEAAEFPEDVEESAASTPQTYKDVEDTGDSNKQESSQIPKLMPVNTIVYSKPNLKLETIWSHLTSKLLSQFAYHLVPLFIAISCSYCFVPLPEYFLGFVAGILMSITFLSLITNTKEILLTPSDEEQLARPVPVLQIQAAEEHAVIERFEGWVNELPYAYDPDNYHVARTKSVYFRLESNTLYIMETRMRVPKRAIWDEPKHKFKFTRKRVYNLNAAKVELLPEGLIRRRRWSKKYPICVTLQKDALLQNVVLKESSDKEDLILLEKDDKLIEKEAEEGEKESDKSNEQGQQQKEDEHDDDTLNQEFEEYEEYEEEEETDEDLTMSRDEKENFEDCQTDDEYSSKYKLFIFARADREKEDWYRRLVAASNPGSKRNSISLTNDTPISLNALLNQQGIPEFKSFSSESGSGLFTELSYNTYMTRLLDNISPPSDNGQQSNDIGWFNCLLGRVLFDIHKCPDCINLIQNKIQRKLSNIKLPYYMESLLMSEVLIGQGAPVIHNITNPTMDERGLWFDLTITYKACITMTVETKLNLMKLTRTGSVSNNSSDIPEPEKSKAVRSPIFDSDIEDSPETSTEDDDTSHVTVCNTSKELTPPQSSGKKFLNMVDRIAANKYFQHATELSYVRRALEGVSNTEIRLMVNVSSIEGCLTVNIPPAPSDRLWYGFRPLPKVALTVKPALGERSVNIGYVTKWIETKLLREFEKVVVLPNMDDLIIPLCPNYPYLSTS